MAYKRIYLVKRNHIVIASEPTVSAIREAIVKKAVVGEGSQIPSLPTFIRRLRLYQELNFETTLKNKYEVLEWKNSRYNRSRV